MRVVMLMFDSLNRHMLSPYGCDWTKTPNFTRLAERVLTFDRSYVCSMPCMPARRDLHTGRPNFMHRSWGPIEPFDDSLPELLRAAGVSSHLLSDHYHYWEDGGATYHNRYDTWQCFRGQEGDQWMGQVAEPPIPDNINPKGRRQDWVNRQFIRTEADYSQTQTLDAGVDFIDRNHGQQNWFLQIECFDPHEPFCSPEKYHELYPDDYEGPLFDWPGYHQVTETPEQVAHCRNNYASLVSMCDHSLGRVLDAFDKHDLWSDTMLIVWTDHGFMLGEHDWWAKNVPPMYEEIAHTPFFIWDPRHPDTAGHRRIALIQPAIDLAPTLLGFFGQPATSDMRGHDLAPVIASDQPVREAAIFGYHGASMNVTDGRYVYLHSPEHLGPTCNYTLMPTHMRGFFNPAGLAQAQLRAPFMFTKNIPVLAVPGNMNTAPDLNRRPCLLFDLQTDPRQNHPLDDPAVRDRMIRHALKLMRDCDAPPELYYRLGMEQTVGVDA